jgi:UDP-glucose 4-epimerase
MDFLRRAMRYRGGLLLGIYMTVLVTGGAAYIGSHIARGWSTAASSCCRGRPTHGDLDSVVRDALAWERKLKAQAEVR